MGLFGAIGKGLKRVARNKIVRGALNSATGGLSEKAISIGKGLGVVMKGNKPVNPTLAQRARVAVADSGAPVVPTYTAPPGMTPGLPEERRPIWGTSVEKYIKPGLRKRLPSGKSSPSSRSATKPKRSAKRSTAAKPTPSKAPKKRAPASNGSKPKRKLSPGMAARAEHTKRVAVMWREEGKPGKFFDYLKQHPFKG